MNNGALEPLLLQLTQSQNLSQSQSQQTQSQNQIGSLQDLQDLGGLQNLQDHTQQALANSIASLNSLQNSYGPYDLLASQDNSHATQPTHDTQSTATNTQSLLSPSLHSVNGYSSGVGNFGTNNWGFNQNWGQNQALNLGLGQGQSQNQSFMNNMIGNFGQNQIQNQNFVVGDWNYGNVMQNDYNNLQQGNIQGPSQFNPNGLVGPAGNYVNNNNTINNNSYQMNVGPNQGPIYPPDISFRKKPSKNDQIYSWVQNNQSTSKNDTFIPENEIKAWVYCWLMKKKIRPEYEILTLGIRPNQTFQCQLTLNAMNDKSKKNLVKMRLDNIVVTSQGLRGFIYDVDL